MNIHLERFLRFAAINTTSDENAGTTPSSQGQWTLANMLRDEMQAMGLNAVSIDENCYVYGLLPANCAGQPTIALIAHLDTADAVSGRDFKPQVRKFEGGDLILNEGLGVVLSSAEFPELNDFVGQDLVVTDGTTVLGADDKAGIVEILGAAEHLLQHPAIPHGDIWLVFTPDEEIGSGAELLQLEKIKADFGYTVDGGAIHEIEYENFNAASARVVVHGRNVHPGYAKGKMINALQVALRYHASLPSGQCPEMTEKYEGFYHLRSMQGNEERAVMDYLVRDHDRSLFENKKAQMQVKAEAINAAYGRKVVEVSIKDSYHNMKEVIDRHPEVLARAEKAIRACGLEPQARPIRGGTDGARLSFRGLPCPNLGTGGMNWHGIHEFLPVNALENMVKVLVEVVRA